MVPEHAQTFTIDLTDRCQLRCTTCTKWQTNTHEAIKEELSSAEWKQVLKQLSDWGCLHVTFSGGEAFLRNGIFDLFDRARSLGMSTLAITNGYGLKRLIETDPQRWPTNLIVSLNSVINPQIHDYMRGTPGSCEQIQRDLEQLIQIQRDQRLDMEIEIQAIVSKDTVDELIPLAQYAKELGVGIGLQLKGDSSSFHPYLTMESSFDAHYELPSELRQEYEYIAERIQEPFKKLLSRNLLGRRKYPTRASKKDLNMMCWYLQHTDEIVERAKCLVGENNFSIDPYGNVRLCYNMAPIGNILESTPQQLWTNSAAQRTRECIDACPMHCRLLGCNPIDTGSIL